ncbi:MAG: prolipoprotein diacylglyceryl transferase [Acidimicrobiia bacterium]|nr:prolipoprotein diacylglyceryl transferase [Acidimicrobiia bacterium]
MLAAIPYTTFPTIDLGFFELRTFGLMVGLGVLLGSWIAGRYIEDRAGIPREETYRMATRLVVAGVIGARITWDISHWDQIESPLDLIAVWEGGLQFSGGFLGAIVFGVPFFRRWNRRQRWIAADGYALGLSIGLAIGRIGCYSVGEHFGSATSFFLGSRYDGGAVREDFLGDTRLVPGTVFHNTALYELLYLLALFVLLGFLSRRRLGPSTLMGTFCLVYGLSRFGTDFLRVNDETVLGFTGAQYLMAAIALASIWIFTVVRPKLAEAAPGPSADTGAAAAGDADGESVVDDGAAAELDADELDDDEAGAEPAAATGDGDERLEPADER